MSGKKQVFVLGGTGYVGASVLQKLVKHPQASQSEFTVLVRSEDKAKKLEAFVESTGFGNVKVLLGSNADPDKLEAQSAKSDVVFSMADSDNVPAIKAVLAGMKKRFEQTGKAPILIHTSGTGILMDKAEGHFESETVYEDTNIEQIEALPDTQLHRDVDLVVTAAGKQGYVKTYIVLPTQIFGLGSGPLFDAGIAHRHSIVVPFLIRTSLARGAAGVVNEGLAKWACVHIDDTANLFIVVYDAALSGKGAHGREGYYYAENGEYKWYDLSKAVADVLVALGKSDKAGPTLFTKEEGEKLGFFFSVLGTNARCSAKRSRALGWKAAHAGDEILKSVKPEMEAILQASK
ncbi:NAD(P)-binding protein [Coniophora puteana RWD-64-598 SS2]|uniref:NAD(P)-binding protein n=1 Tax=Coniophora puteana (strain RWD-64-598) TaxID=741705 RepID=A0A5M3MY90_CONPW|nr:NAD(P)-binding protein [Coniophora puteana RWD-64-598 SS2]EIW84069.1 NAD(P)-binding protein [Coniophora puteana RWD-64-598 SS2]